MLRNRIGQLIRRGAARKRRGRNAIMRDGGCSREFGRVCLAAKWGFCLAEMIGCIDGGGSGSRVTIIVQGPGIGIDPQGCSGEVWIMAAI